MTQQQHLHLQRPLHKAVSRIEAVTVCHNYADFLEQTLPRNLAHFDHYLVVTHEDDRRTINLCHKLGVECRRTNLMHFSERDPFAKARAIDFGLAYLRRDDWVVHLDADVYLPPTTRNILNTIPLDPACIYGVDRCNCTSFDAWQQFIRCPALNLHQHTEGCLTLPPTFPLGARITLPHYGGYVPIGFFQLWNAGRFPHRRYPLNQGSAEHTDVLHAIQWPAPNRRLIPEIIAVHLESEPADMGANWTGRRTREFGPKPVANAPGRGSYCQ